MQVVYGICEIKLKLIIFVMIDYFENKVLVLNIGCFFVYVILFIKSGFKVINFQGIIFFLVVYKVWYKCYLREGQVVFLIKINLFQIFRVENKVKKD